METAAIKQQSLVDVFRSSAQSRCQSTESIRPINISLACERPSLHCHHHAGRCLARGARQAARRIKGHHQDTHLQQWDSRRQVYQGHQAMEL